MQLLLPTRRLMLKRLLIASSVALFVLAYAESLLRSLRRGRKRVTGTVGLVIIGALTGVAAVIVSWLIGRAEPVPATTVVCVLLGAVAGGAAAVAAVRVSYRRRRKAPVRT